MADYTYDTEIGRYRDAAGHLVPQEDIDDLANEIVRNVRGVISVLSGQYNEGQITAAQFASAMEEVISDAHIAAGALAGGGFSNINAIEEKVQDKLAAELTYLDNFMAQLEDLTPAQIDARAQMYGQATWGTYQQIQREEAAVLGYSEERNILANNSDSCDECIEYTDLEWVEIGTLPPVGQRACFSHCNCYIEYRQSDKKNQADNNDNPDALDDERQTAAIHAASVVAKYSEDQERDDHGRFGSGSGSSDSSSDSGSKDSSGKTGGAHFDVAPLSKALDEKLKDSGSWLVKSWDDAAERVGAKDGAELRDKVDAHLTEIVKNAEPFIRTTPEGLAGVLSEGRFKTIAENEQFLKDNAWAAESAKIRVRQEQEFMNIDPSTPPSERPTYGYLHDSPDGGQKEGPTIAKAYGDIVVRLKPEVRERTSVNVGDTADLSAKTVASQPSWRLAVCPRHRSC
jgi:HPt (histidine-containing phosphotransfer) domain-containing protein